MRGLTKRWLLDDACAASEAPPASSNGDLVQRILRARGFADADQCRRFCEPKLTDLHEPALLPGIERAAARLVAAVRAGEPIVIYGDYDVDGITATAILYHTIKAAAPNAPISTYVPHRIDEGYGLNSESIRQLAAPGSGTSARGAKVIVSVDCGITAVEPAAAARAAGIDLIITDHHSAPGNGRLPTDAYAIVHPGLPDSDYPFHDLCGAGVAFKLAWHFATVWCGSQRVSEHLQKTLLNLLPLAALGTIADVVPLVDENRILARYGLRLIKQTPIAGLRALIEASDLMKENIDCEKVGFILGPRLNACGRMGHAREAVDLLTTAEGEAADRIAQNLARLNRQRQATEREIFQQACRLAEDAGMTGDDRRIIILAHESWHPGVVGIVCSRLVERFGRPAILLHRQHDQCKGSARSTPGFSIFEAMSACAGHLQTFGGHDVAAGLTLHPDHLPAFVQAMTEHANARIPVEDLTPALRIDCDADLNELHLEAVTRLGDLSPFGRENPRPSVRIARLTLADAPKQMGGQGAHLSLNLRHDSNGGRRWLRGVWWNRGSLAADLAPGMTLDAVIEPKINSFNGRTTVEGEIRDVRLVEQ